MIAMGRRRSPQRYLLPLAAGLCCILLQSDFAFGADDGEDSAIGFLIIAGLVIAAIYFIPTIIAFVRAHPNRWLIALINIAFGGTVIGWFGALIWALSAVHRSPTGSNGGESGLNFFVNDPTTIRILSEPRQASTSKRKSVDQITADLARLKGLKNQGLITDIEFETLWHEIIEEM